MSHCKTLLKATLTVLVIAALMVFITFIGCCIATGLNDLYPDTLKCPSSKYKFTECILYYWIFGFNFVIALATVVALCLAICLGIIELVSWAIKKCKCMEEKTDESIQLVA